MCYKYVNCSKVVLMLWCLYSVYFSMCDFLSMNYDLKIVVMLIIEVKSGKKFENLEIKFSFV